MAPPPRPHCPSSRCHPGLLHPHRSSCQVQRGHRPCFAASRCPTLTCCSSSRSPAWVSPSHRPFVPVGAMKSPVRDLVCLPCNTHLLPKLEPPPSPSASPCIPRLDLPQDRQDSSSLARIHPFCNEQQQLEPLTPLLHTLDRQVPPVHQGPVRPSPLSCGPQPRVRSPQPLLSVGPTCTSFSPALFFSVSDFTYFQRTAYLQIDPYCSCI
ncbi:uncharacterized protein LOC125517212 isoform X3 [Triticum urartu]|uniref:uncharacterized protein LOC125517212 isoform X3 n=1 Tax=Triticum urartu TaxID=4572 RepID=UPI002043BE86|nr:uncharacterized protein LOC125517212 isoform X3 [Triticum urartu]